MAATLTNLTIDLGIEFVCHAAKSLDLTSAEQTLTYSYRQTFGYGAGALQCNALWHDSRTLAASANEDLDLYGSLSDGFGSTLNFANIKILIIENTSY
jgi:hypothetical protein